MDIKELPKVPAPPLDQFLPEGPNGTALFRAPDAVGTPAPKADVEQIVEEWFVEYFHGLGARLDESLYNHLHAAKEALRKRLRALDA